MKEDLERMLPRVVPCMNVVRDGERTCYFMSSGRDLLRCQGRLVPALVERLLPLLDGTRTPAELRAELSGTIDTASVDELLRLLLHHRVVVDAGPERSFSARELEAFASLLALLARSFSNPYRPFERLRRARVVVVGDSELARELLSALAECAIGTIDLVMDEGLPTLVVPQPVHVRAHPFAALRTLLPGADLVIGVQDGEFGFTRRMRELNRLCLGLGTDWLEVRLSLDAEGWIGPLHTPGTACFECVELRRRSHLATWKEQALQVEQVERGLLVGKRLGFAPFQRHLASMVAVEVLLYLTGLEPTRLVGRGLLVDLLTQESNSHPVLKHPACPACGQPPEERLHPWGDEEVRIERTLLEASGRE
ncbi:TOMM precursor leader peptide-binding protein [Archangium lansingense]|uniref:TOMM leader peptide-binding protein n=1 Tax=Archangium lansingense TaxID=2995310 RepID=A0ABT4ARC0_9BACT|nr:TOMM precursor leader peptide-binding protein [Archangium lansinium]MCY1083394.1 TOMM precursor leader peptide-binding protein [Archangium lansinium]